MISKTSFGNGTIDIIIILQSGEIEIFLLRKQFLQLCKKLETRIHIYIYIYIYIAWLAGKCKTKLLQLNPFFLTKDISGKRWRTSKEWLLPSAYPENAIYNWDTVVKTRSYMNSTSVTHYKWAIVKVSYFPPTGSVEACALSRSKPFE